MQQKIDEKKMGSILVLGKALSIIDIIGSSNQPLSLAKIVQLSGLSKTTVHRILQDLVAYQYISVDCHTEYKLGNKILSLGAKTLHGSVGTVGYEDAKALYETIDNTVCLTALNGFEAVYLQRFAPRITIKQNVGDTMPAHCTAFGKCQLAYLPAGKLEELVESYGLIRRTPNTICDLNELKKDLKAILDRGYAINRGEATLQVDGIAAPIFDYSNHCIGALSVAVIVPLQNRDILEYKDQLLQTANKISSKMGYVPA